MTDISDFLLARIEEDEGRAVWIAGRGQGCAFNLDRAVADHFASWDPARVLAECAAKRRIVDLLRYDGNPEAWLTLRHMATVYSSHPDYQTGWVL